MFKSGRQRMTQNKLWDQSAQTNAKLCSNQQQKQTKLLYILHSSEDPKLFKNTKYVRLHFEEICIIHNV